MLGTNYSKWSKLLLFNPKHNLCKFTLKGTGNFLVQNREEEPGSATLVYVNQDVSTACAVMGLPAGFFLQEPLLFSEP